ncbi:hypothetical protein RUM43_009211 [Polyplax serrata]|uniref:Uncharacterized protein n=1 Tax=Polyplax serrata TaxID=468196 RepID=A0AAN8RU88_POLSC
MSRNNFPRGCIRQIEYLKGCTDRDTLIRAKEIEKLREFEFEVSRDLTCLGTDSLLSSPNAGLDLSAISDLKPMSYSGKLYGDVTSTSKLISCDPKFYASEAKLYETRPSDFKYYGNALQSSRAYTADSRFVHCDSSSVKCESEDVGLTYHTYHGYDPSVQSHMVTHS